MQSLDEELFRDFEYVSFDVYDTLVTRPYVRPTDLFMHVERLTGKEGFAAARIEAERSARRVHRREITLDEIYDILGGGYGECRKKELELETSVPVPVKDRMELLEKLKGNGKKIVLVSDMYLPHDTVSKMLEHVGVRYDYLYVSSEFGFSKHNGKLYGHILKDLRIGPSDIVHVGDNRHSDCDMPRSIGIKSILCGKPIDSYRKKHGKEYKFYSKKKSLDRSMIVAADMLSDADASWHGLGYRFGGPLAVSYAIFVNGDGLALYASRDGYNLKRIGEELYPDRKTEYVCAQRLLLDVLTEDALPYGRAVPEKSTYGRNKQKAAIGRILRFYGIGTSGDVVSTYNSTVERLDKLRKEGLESYRAYLKEKCGDGEVHLIDCTTMKFSSQRLIEYVLGRPIAGHYLVALGDSDMEHYAMCRWRRPMIGWTNVNIPEFFLCSPEYPLCGWNGGPVYDTEDENDRFRVSVYGEVSDGELDYAKHYKKLFGKNIISFDYASVVEWSRISAARGCGYRGLLKKIRWASNPDHSDYSNLIVGIGDAGAVIKRLAVGALDRVFGKE